MSQYLDSSIEALQDAVWCELPTMSWADAMKHVAVVLEHVHLPSVASDHLASAAPRLKKTGFTKQVAISGGR
jgi:hypothetical protein